MKNQNQTINTATTGSLVKIIIMASVFTAFSLPALAGSDYQQNMLFSPSDSMLKAEQRGRINIYDGLESNVVEKAMDEQFDRIENMMFVRVTHVQDDGEVTVEDDGCDS